MFNQMEFFATKRKSAFWSRVYYFFLFARGCHYVLLLQDLRSFQEYYWERSYGDDHDTDSFEKAPQFGRVLYTIVVPLRCSSTD